MSRALRHAPTLLWIGLLALLATGQGWRAGYMDEAYYLTVGRELAHGRGMQEPFLWNYLTDPQSLPQPAGGYWAPAAAWLAALGVALARVPDAVLAAPAWDARGLLLRISFVALAALVPGLTARLTRALGGGETEARWAARWAMAPAFYLAFLTAADGFAGLMVLGAGFWWTAARLDARGGWRAGLLGALAGGIHLFRAEGWLWLALAIVLGWRAARGRGAGAVVFGYLAVMAPWWARQTRVWGAPFPPGQSRVLWLTTYNDLFLYPASQLTWARWWARGWRALMHERLWALGQNLQTLLAVQGGLALVLPWALLGGWRVRGQRVVRAAVGMELALLGLMTVVFPHPGVRGGFFHASAGLQPMVWALAGLGLPAGLRALAQRRGWDPNHAQRYLGTGLWALLMLFSLGLAAARLRAWGISTCLYQQAYAQWPSGHPARVIINNPPLWTWVTGQPAVVTPTGSAQAYAQVAERYRVPWLLLEANHPPEVRDWYEAPRDRDGFRYWGTLTWTEPCAAQPPARLYQYPVSPRGAGARALIPLRNVPRGR